jgi:aryl-alcohol dehydrogenase-like predicted oxidoreductase
MELVTLGRAAVRVSRLCLGTMSFGPRTGREESFAILDAAEERGVNFLDTASSYGRRGGVRGEELLGEWLAASAGRRDRFVVATKVSAPIGEGVNDRGLSAKHIRRACEDSLRGLRTDYIDLYQMHHIDRSAGWEEVWQAMGQLQREGKVLYVGSSNFAGWHIAQASEAARRWSLMGPVSEQSVYNLANRAVELEVLPACRAYGMGFLAYSPVAGGVLSGALQRTPDPATRTASLHSQQLLERRREAVARFEALCAPIAPPAEVALAWVWSRAGVTSVIAGPRTMAHFESAIRALDLRLDAATLAQLEAIFPGPGGEAPEAYAW